jgi:hypothetical protein
MFAVFATTAAEMAAAQAAAAAATTAATAAAPTIAATTAAAATPAVASALPGIVGGSGALAPAAGAAQAASVAPQIAGTASTLAQASPEIAANLAAGNAPGIMQAMTPEAVQQSAMAAGSGFPMPVAQTGTVPPVPAGELPNAAQVMQQNLTRSIPGAPTNLPGNMTGMQNAAETFQRAQGITQAPIEPLGNVGPVMPESAGLPGNMTSLASNVPPLEAPAADATLNGLQRGIKTAIDLASKGWEEYKKAPAAAQYLGAGLAAKKLGLFEQKQPEGRKQYKSTDMSGFRPSVSPFSPYTGQTGFADGGPVEAMSNMNAVGANPYYPMSQQPRLAYSTPGIQNPVSQNVLDVGGAGRLDPYTGMPAFASGGPTDQPDYKKMLEGKSPDELERDARRAKATAEAGGFGIVPRSRAQQLSSPATAAQAELAAMMKKYGIKSALPKVKEPQDVSAADTEYAAGGGIMYNLGGYSDGGRLLKGPGDGVSDSIPASIGGRQPARLADGEFVIPARIVSELGNGSTDAGARKLYAMMDRVQKGRKKSVGKGKVAVNSKADKHLPA